VAGGGSALQPQQPQIEDSSRQKQKAKQQVRSAQASSY
jgi:hypothetical protein